MECSIIRCDADRLVDLFAFRARVWTEEGADPSAFPGGSWSDAADDRRMHWIALVEDRIVGAASISFHDSLAEVDEPHAYRMLASPQAGIIAAPARVVVDGAHRGRGIADAMLDRQDQAAREAHAVFAVRQASPAMRRLLLRRGWREHGPGPADARFPGVVFSVMSLSFDGAL
jgi:GNAT superfamily N-acetyltransferase